MDCQQLVDELRTFLQSNDMTSVDRLEKYAKDYGTWCQETNQRLRRCDEYLKKGLRAEAIHFAQVEPPLLDMVAILDFPEESDLRKTLAFYNIAEPPRLLMKAAAALNQAYAEEQPLEELMRNHRQLALARAPLGARLKTMRQIAKLDKNNLVWGDDIRVFEAARLREIQIEAADQANQDNTDWITEIAKELKDNVWLTPPPASVADPILRQAAEGAREQAKLSLDVIAWQLESAKAKNDLAQAKDLRSRYLAKMKELGMSREDPLAAAIERSVSWLYKQEDQQARDLEYQNALADLETALDGNAARDRITRLYHRALDFQRGLPKRLMERCQDYVSQVDSSRRWRERLILMAVFFIGAMGLLAFIAYLWLFKNQ
jgi:hypothetical protein